jgi:methylated-DNA-[protein]-cysteine S-methyltransferase
MHAKGRYTAVETKFGWVMLVGSERGLRSVSFPEPSLESALARAAHSSRDALADAAAFGDLPVRLQRYFEGEAVEFTDTLDYGEASAFQREVWEATRLIPHGNVATYGSVAARIGRPRACRAVGTALGQNAIPIVVPCHRVVASGGGLGGFGGGLALKRSLLDLEKRRAAVASSQGLQ